MNSNLVFRIFNIMGILNLEKDGECFRKSNFHLIMNGLKICGLVLFKNQINEIFAMNIRPRQFHHRPSLFSNGFIIVHKNQLIVAANLTILLQLITAQKNVNLFNLLSRFRRNAMKLSPKCEIVFERYDKYCARNLAVVVIILSAGFVLAFFATMNRTFEAFMGLVLYQTPYFINVAFICYFNHIIQYIKYSQEALNMFAMSLHSEPLVEDKLMAKNISTMYLSLFSIKQYFLSFLRLQIFNIIFYFISEIVFQVC